MVVADTGIAAGNEKITATRQANLNGNSIVFTEK
jgi:hypothetical protein